MLRRTIRKNNKRCQTMNSAVHLYLEKFEKSENFEI